MMCEGAPSVPVNKSVRASRLTSCKTDGWLETERSDAAVCICPDSTSSSQPQTGPVGEQTRLSEVVWGATVPVLPSAASYLSG